jgi:UDP-N-acetylglucosamine:LPS N-acetylglucosamine transferase
MKICLAASAGGHLSELLRLRPVYEGKPHFFVTTRASALELLGVEATAYDVGWGNRKHLFLTFKMVVRCIGIMLKERPDVVISTGAAVGCILALTMKLAGGKVIWIDTISHTDYLTMSGRIIRPFADQFFVQWSDLADKYPGTTYVGSLL